MVLYITDVACQGEHKQNSGSNGSGYVFWGHLRYGDQIIGILPLHAFLVFQSKRWVGLYAFWSSGIKLLGFGSLTTSLGYYPWSNLQNLINFVDPSNKYIPIYLSKQETLQTGDRKVRNTLPITQISRVGQGCIFLRSWLIFMA